MPMRLENNELHNKRDLALGSIPLNKYGLPYKFAAIAAHGKSDVLLCIVAHIHILSPGRNGFGAKALQRPYEKENTRDSSSATGNVSLSPVIIEYV